MRWNWIRLDLEEETSTIGPGYLSAPEAIAPMQPQVETRIDLYPTMQPAAHYWLSAQSDDDSLTIGRFVYGLDSCRGDIKDAEFEAGHWVSSFLARQGDRDEN